MPPCLSFRFAAPIALAFAAGASISPVAQRLLPAAQAQTAPSAGLTPMIIDVAALKDADLAATPNPDLRSKTLVSTEYGTLAVQIGNVAKHFHANAHELQYIVEGSGTAWLGDKKQEIRPSCFMRFLPSFCFSSSLRLRLMSPP